MKQHEVVIDTIEKLGGIATLGQIYQETLKNPEFKHKGPTPQKNIMRIVQMRSKEIYKIRPGLYGLVKYQKKNESEGIKVETVKSTDSAEIIISKHAYYQGILLEIGNYRKFQTFCPNRDQCKSYVGGQILGDIRTIKTLPFQATKEIDKHCREIDIIWINEREMPSYCFEVEHSTLIKEKFVKFHEIQDLSTKMIIVASDEKRGDFLSVSSLSTFKSIRERVKFLNYGDLEKQYLMMMQIMKFETVILS